MRSLTLPPWATGRRLGAAALATIAAVLLSASSCEPGPTAQQQDAARSQQSTERIIQQQPVQSGEYSPTRATMNGWVETWMSRPGVKYYAYLYNQGQLMGYYVLQGPPVSYAAGATSPYRTECNSVACPQVPNPGQDAAFANQGTGQFQFYGMDAASGRILEWGGVGMTYFGSNAPLNIPGATPLGDAR